MIRCVFRVARRENHALAHKSLGDVQIARAILLCVNIKMRAAHIVSGYERSPERAEQGRGFNGPTKEASMVDLQGQPGLAIGLNGESYHTGTDLDE
jgi:hypothetical protein